MTPYEKAMKDAEKYLLTLDYTGREHKRSVLLALIAAVRAESTPTVTDEE